MIVGTTITPSDFEVIVLSVFIVVSCYSHFVKKRNNNSDDDNDSTMMNSTTHSIVTIKQYRDMVERIVYESIYLPNRSMISLSIRFVIYFWDNVHNLFPITTKTTTTTSIRNTITQPFTCEICLLRLGGQDSDTDRFRYGCTCAGSTTTTTTTMIICKHCIRTDIVYQITNQHKSVPLCIQRKCCMDDRYVRKRVDELFCTSKRQSIIQLLDRNQIEEACNNNINNNDGTTPENKNDISSNTSSSFHSRINKNNTKGNVARTERFWRCPTPDCTFAAFVSDATHYVVPMQKQPYNPLVLLSSMTQYMNRMITNTVSTLSSSSSNQSSTPTPTTPTTNHGNSYNNTNVDPRKVTCPVCNVSSCQLCSMIWSIGIVQHDRIHCTEHERSLTQTFGSSCYSTNNNNDNDTRTKNSFGRNTTKNTTNNTKLYYGLQQWKQNKMKHDLIRDCPSCKIVIEKNAGCKHMTCTLCKYEFCWICNQKWYIGHMNVNCSTMS